MAEKPRENHLSFVHASGPLPGGSPRGSSRTRSAPVELLYRLWAS